jgi:sister-chromatid-cohesion protein PDS5
LGSRANGCRYIELYLDVVASRDNVGLLYHVAGKIKSVQDIKYVKDVSKGTTEEQEEYASLIKLKNEVCSASSDERHMLMKRQSLWRLSELAQIIIRNRAEAKGWSITTYPGKVKLPKDLFHNLKTHADVLEVSGSCLVVRAYG